MGTRHLIAVIKDGKPRIAQYGQWDGYPTGQGRGVLEFAQSLVGTIPGVEQQFNEALSRCRFARDDEELERLWSDDRYRQRFLTRDLGSDILDQVLGSDGEIVLRDSYDFGGDSLSCEYAYVLDMDARTLETYKGFQKTDPPEGERFCGTRPAGNSYGPVHLVKSFSFDALPTLADFCAAFETAGEDA